MFDHRHKRRERVKDLGLPRAIVDRTGTIQLTTTTDSRYRPSMGGLLFFRMILDL